MTIYAILLDDYQRAGDGIYHACFRGNLAECRAETSFDGSSDPLLRRDYEEVCSEPTSLTDGPGNLYRGRIVGLQPLAAALAAETDAPRGRRYIGRPAALAALGVAIGVALGRGGTKRASRQRRR